MLRFTSLRDMSLRRNLRSAELLWRRFRFVSHHFVRILVSVLHYDHTL